MSVSPRPRILTNDAHYSSVEDPRPAKSGVFFYIPELFDITLFPKLTKLADETHWMLHKLICLSIAYRHSGKKWVNISQQTIRTFIHARHARLVQNELLRTKVIECNYTYKQGSHSQGWRLASTYTNQIKRIEVTKPAMIAKMLKHRISIGSKIVPEAQLNQIHQHLLASLRLVRIDKDRAYSVVDQLPPRARKVPARVKKMGSRGRTKLVKKHQQEQQHRQALCRMTIDQIRDGEIDFNVDHAGRLHTPITRLLTDARKCLSINGKPLINIDIRNSQLIFFTMMLLENQYDRTIQEEQDPLSPFSSLPCSALPLAVPLGGEAAAYDENGFDIGTARGRENTGEKGGEKKGTQEFIALVMDGSIYDYLLREYNQLVEGTAEHKITSRKEFKQQFFEKILYGNTDQRHVADSPLALLFRTLFPGVWDFIVDQKQWSGRGDPNRAFANLAVRMQQREALFMIGRVCTRLMVHHGEVPIVTIHDSIMTTPEHADLVFRVMLEEFARLGVRPALRREA